MNSVSKTIPYTSSEKAAEICSWFCWQRCVFIHSFYHAVYISNVRVVVFGNFNCRFCVIDCFFARCTLKHSFRRICIAVKTVLSAIFFALRLCFIWTVWNSISIRRGFMEMQIASTAMAMAMSNMQNGLAVGMLKKTMEASEQSMEAITDMLDSMPSPDGKGQLLDVRVWTLFNVMKSRSIWSGFLV